MEGKYIHYCWFGGKPLPKLAKKCLASWRKFLPDYKIIRWDESNVNLNEAPFLKEAYEAKMYAFVADYIRTKAINDMGGIYLDTDMEITKDISDLLSSQKTFLGVEDTGKVACGVWYEPKPHSYLSTRLLKKYRSFSGFNHEERASFSIPLLITEILEPCGFSYKKRTIQELKHNIVIYPRDYFYPYSYNRSNNLFTDHTCMIHYYDASWLPFKNRIENYLIRHFGRINAIRIIKTYQKTMEYVHKVGRIVLYPVVLYRAHKNRQALITPSYLKGIDQTLNVVNKNQNLDYVVLHNPGWFGVTGATVELFQNIVPCGELYRKSDIKKIATAIASSHIKQVIFSGASTGYDKLALRLKKINPSIKIKVFWHGSMSQVLDPYGWRMHNSLIKLCRQGIITAFATCKQSLLNFYLHHGVKAVFITNKVTNLPSKTSSKNQDQQIRIGLYSASSTNWRKNLYTQIVAASLVKDAKLDIIPLDDAARNFAQSIGLEVEGEPSNISREQLIKRMAKNTVNLYVTFSECSPMLPLESLGVKVPCITGNNHHYFQDSPLADYLIVDDETDPQAIKQKIVSAITHRDKIIKEYQQFDTNNLAASLADVNKFLEA